jgi:hypothetical protein
MKAFSIFFFAILASTGLALSIDTKALSGLQPRNLALNSLSDTNTVIKPRECEEPAEPEEPSEADRNNGAKRPTRPSRPTNC